MEISVSQMRILLLALVLGFAGGFGSVSAVGLARAPAQLG